MLLLPLSTTLGLLLMDYAKRRIIDVVLEYNLLEGSKGRQLVSPIELKTVKTCYSARLSTSTLVQMKTTNVF